MSAGPVGRAVIARRRLKRAAGLLREATADLAALSGDADTIGVVQVNDEQSAQEALAMMRVALTQHGSLDVVILAPPRNGA